MAIKNLVKKYFTSPLLVISLICFILGGITWGWTKNNQANNLQTNKVLGVTQTITITPSQSPTIKQTKTDITKPTITTTIPTNLPLSKPTNTPTVKPTESPTPSTKITLQIKGPEGDFSYSLNFHDNSNPCSILNDAKKEGKINSVTITHYGPPLNSDYVQELNGHQNNWTFAINGTFESMGCSNYTLKPQDTVLWKYN